MITNLRPLLLTHIVSLIIASDKDAVVTVTVMFRPNDDNKSGKTHSVQIVGPHEEIDANLPKLIAEAACKVSEFGTTMADLDAQIAEAKKEKEAVLKAEREAAKPKADKADKGEVVARTMPKAPIKQPSTSSAPLTSGLVPASASPAAQSSIADLGL